MYTASEILVQGSVAAGFEKVWQIISIYIRRLHNPCFQCSSFIFILCRKHFQTSRCKTRISWSIGEKCFPSPVPAWRGCTWHLKCFFPELQRIVLFFNTVTWGYNFRRKANGFLYILWFCPPFNQYHQFPVNLDLSKLSSDFCSTLHFRPWKAGVKKIKKKKIENFVYMGEIIVRWSTPRSPGMTHPSLATLSSCGQIYFNIFRYFLRKVGLVWFATS